MDTYRSGHNTDGMMARKNLLIETILKRLGKKHKWPIQEGKKEVLNTLDMLDKKVEHTPLQAEEINIKQCLNNRLAHLLREEEIK
jgi:hypothetical protein